MLKLTPNALARGLLGYINAKSGRREEAEKIAADSTRASTHAMIYAGLGDKDRTMAALVRLSATGPLCLGDYLEQRALRKKVGLPE